MFEECRNKKSILEPQGLGPEKPPLRCSTLELRWKIARGLARRKREVDLQILEEKMKGWGLRVEKQNNVDQ